MSRIRQIKPSWFLDKVLRRGTTADAREFYIGLWMLADDAGWLEWDVERIAAELYPYDPVAKREQAIERWAATLETLVPADPHLVVMTCGHARVPHMPKHQRIAGNQSFTVANIHVGSQGLRPPELCVAASSRVSLQVTDQAPSSDESLQVATGSPGIGRVGNGTERNGTVPLPRAGGPDGPAARRGGGLKARVEAHGYRPLTPGATGAYDAPSDDSTTGGRDA